MRISDWSSDVCSSDLSPPQGSYRCRASLSLWERTLCATVMLQSARNRVAHRVGLYKRATSSPCRSPVWATDGADRAGSHAASCLQFAINAGCWCAVMPRLFDDGRHSPDEIGRAHV